MSQKTLDFIASFGTALVGVVFVFLGSVFFTHQKVEPVAAQLPLSQNRIITENAIKRAAMFPVSRPLVPVMHDKKECRVAMTAASVVVVDDKTNTVLYKKNGSDVRSLASITKLMSAMVLSDLPISWTSSTEIIEADIQEDHHVQVGEVYTLKDLWGVALVGSSNSAINALVRNSGLSYDEFVLRMNEKSRKLGLQSTRFVEPTGLDSRNMSTAIDVARMLKYALDISRIRETLAIGEYDARPFNKKEKRVWSTNWLLTNWVPSMFGKQSIVGKTGYITDSGYNFAVRILDQKGRSVRVVVLGAATNEYRFSEARDVAEWVFANYTWPDEHVASVVTQ